MIKQPIFPYFGKGQSGAATAANATLTLSNKSKQIVLTNIGTQVIYTRITVAADATLASSADYPLLPNTQQTFSIGTEATKVSYIAPAGAGSTLHAIEAEGY